MARNLRPHPATCALDGCEVPVVRRPGGGRPRLYCSDAHRAEARRRRLGSLGTLGAGQAALAEPGGELEAVRALLHEALAGLERAQTAVPRDEALVAAIRAEATAEVLRAQQAAADAARHAAAAEDRLARERGEWQGTLEELARDRAEHVRAIEELSGAVDGARAELEQELLRHHGDAEHAEAVLVAERAAHAADAERLGLDLDDLRRRLAGAQGAADEAEQRCLRAERLVAERAAAVLELEVRAARAEEQSDQATARLNDAKQELARMRTELAGERRHHRAVEAELRRRAAQPASAGPARRRRTTSQTRTAQPSASRARPRSGPNR